MISSQENPRWDLLTAELLPPPELLIKRDEHASRLAHDIACAETRIVVLYAPSNSGKSEMVRNRILPRLVEENPDIGVFYAKCKPHWPRQLRGGSSSATLADALRRPSIVILDSFERVLDLPRDEQRSELDALFAEFGHADPAARLVLVTDARQLSGIYALERYYPDATRAKYELPSITVHDAVLSVVRTSPDVQFTHAFVDALSDECAELSRTSWGNTLPLVRLVHEWAVERAHTLGVTMLDVDELRRAGGARAILRRHVEQQLESLDEANPDDSDVARALLEYLAEQPSGSGAPDLNVLARRTGIRVAIFDRVIDTLAVPGGLLRKRPFGGLRVVPPQALAIIEADVHARADQTERVRRLVADGFRDWEESGRLLSAARFHEIHAERRYLSLSAGETRFVLQCALLQGGEQSAGAAAYWVERVERPEDQLEILLRSTFHENWNVRRRAVEILVRFADDPTASRRALEVAIGDEDHRVRAQAVRSLRDLGTPAERDKLLHEAASAHSPYRAAALAALAAFREPAVVALLAEIVEDHDADRELRLIAIDSLRVLETSDAVTALIAIALHDLNESDRTGATAALARLRSPVLIRQVLDALATTRRRLLRWSVAIVTAAVASVGLVVGVVIFAGIWDADPFLGAGYAIGAGLMLGVTAKLLRRHRDLSRKPNPAERFIAIVLYALSVFTILPLVHGLASFAIHRRRKAARLFWLELLALLIWATALYVVKPYSNTDNTLTRGVVVTFEYICYATALLLFWGSFLSDVVGVFIGTLVMREAMMSRNQRDAIHERLFANAEAARIAANALVRPGDAIAWSPRRLLRRYGLGVPSDLLIEWLRGDSPQLRRIAHRALRKTKREATVQGLESLWRDANPSLRRRVLRILWGAPNERSLDALDRLRPQLSPPQRFRATVARWTYPLLIWPWGARVMIVALLPTLAIVLADGWRVRHTPGWSMIVALRPPNDSASAQRDAEIVQSLGRPSFADASAGYLMHMLPQTNPRDSITQRLHSALVISLGGMPPRVTNRFPKWRSSIDSALTVYDSLLLRGTSPQRTSAVNVLSRMAVAQDLALAQHARGSLVNMLATRAADTLPAVATRAVTAMGQLPAMVRLIALDTILQRRKQVFGGGWLNDALIAIATNSVDSVSRALFDNPDSARRDSLVGIFTGLSGYDASIQARLSQLKACDVKATRCDWRAEAIHGVDAAPDDEESYIDLANHYADHQQLPEGVRILEHLADSMKTNFWPRRVVATVLHERIGPDDPSAFERSWHFMSEARALPSYQALRTTNASTYRTLEDDYLEIALTAKRYVEVDTLAAQHLASNDETATGQYNAALFRYLAAALRGDARLAATRLAQLDTVLAGWDSKGFANGWQYPGTTAFLRKSELPPALKDAALALCKPGSWKLPDDRITLIAANQRALRSLGAQSGSANPAADRP